VHNAGRLVALILCAAIPAQAQGAQSCGQPQEITGRPRIGLALSGGGGKGWAHIGVLKELIKLRVPIDCIAGTSAGSIVGGVYASGLPVEEMERIVRDSNWSVLFQDSAPRQERSFARKAENRRGLWDLELGVSLDGIKLPSGVFAGQGVNALLRRMTSGAVGIDKFDDLQIPFRAVATDLRTGELVVLDGGELAAAMRASMAVPGAFTPEAIDGRLLVDGGLRENLPVNTVRAMGADVVIAVDLGTRSVTDTHFNNPLAVARQMLDILLGLNVQAARESLRPTDVLISLPVQDYSSADFSKGNELVPIGERAVENMRERLAALSVPESEYVALREEQRTRGSTRARVARVEVDSGKLRHVNPVYVRNKFATTAENEEFDEQRIQEQIAGLLGEGDYERIDYHYEVGPDGQRAAVVTPRDKSWGPGYLGLGMQLATDFKEQTYFNLIGSYRRTWLNSLGARWRNDFSLGQTTSLRSEWYQPVWSGHGLFVAPVLWAGQSNQNLFVGNLPVASYRIRSFGGEIGVGWTFSRYAEARLSAESGRRHFEPSIALSVFPSEDFSAGGLVGRFTADRLDSASFPHTGYLLSAMYRSSMPSLGADSEYRKGTISAITAFDLGRHTLQLNLEGGGAVGGELPIYDLQQLGGLFNLSGYLINQFQGQRSALGRATYYYRMTDVPVVLKGLYTGLSLEAGQVYDRLDGTRTSGLLPAAALFIGADSALGPFYLAYGHAFEHNINTVYLYFGTPY
jgi:NTE family protein